MHTTAATPLLYRTAIGMMTVLLCGLPGIIAIFRLLHEHMHIFQAQLLYLHAHRRYLVLLRDPSSVNLVIASTPT